MPGDKLLGRKTTLAKCPIGLFLSEWGNLCLKTEYGSNEGRIDAYIVSSGEFFWGDSPQTIERQRKQMVTPVRLPRVMEAMNRRAPAVTPTREEVARVLYAAADDGRSNDTLFTRDAIEAVMALLNGERGDGR